MLVGGFYSILEIITTSLWTRFFDCNFWISKKFWYWGHGKCICMWLIYIRCWCKRRKYWANEFVISFSSILSVHATSDSAASIVNDSSQSSAMDSAVVVKFYLAGRSPPYPATPSPLLSSPPLFHLPLPPSFPPLPFEWGSGAGPGKFLKWYLLTGDF